MRGAVNSKTRTGSRQTGGQDACGNTKCGGDVDKEAICCDACERWYHNRCSKLDPRAISLYVVNKYLKWVCYQCIAQIRNRPANSSGEKVASTIRLNKGTDCAGLEPLVDPATGHTNESNKSKPRTRDTKGTSRIAQLEVEKRKTEEDQVTLNDLREQVTAHEEAIKALLRDKTSLSQAVKHLKTTNDLALGRNRNVVIKGIPEPFMKESRQRERAIRYHVTNLLRMAGIPGTTILKRLLRLGKWKRDAAPRPVVVEFANPRLRDKLLARAVELNQKTGGRLNIEPDDTAGWKDKTTRPQQAVVGAKPLVRVSKLPECSPRTKSNTADVKEPPRLEDPTQGSLDGWVLVGTRRSTIKNGERPRT